MASHLEDVLSNLMLTYLRYNLVTTKKQTHVLLHALDASKSGFKRLLIVTVDTDVAALALCHFFNFYLQEVGIKIGIGKNC